MDNSKDYASEFNAKFKEAQVKKRQTIKRPNILVCGYTGCGKSSLAKAILGDAVPDSAVGGEGRPKTMDYDCYESDEIRIWDSRGLELGETEAAFTEITKKFIRERQGDPNVDNHIHIVWYALQGPGARVTDCDINLIKNIFLVDHLAAVITKKDITRPAQLEALTKRLVEDAGLPPERIVATSDAEGGLDGCEELVQLSYKMLPAAYKGAFAEAQRIDKELRIQALNDKRTQATAIIVSGTGAAAAIGAVPIPFSDAALLIPTQLGMIASLAVLYGLSTEAVEVAVLPFLLRLAGMYTATSLLKLIPGVGSAVNASVAGVLTGATGWYVQSHFYDIALAKINGEPLPKLIFDFSIIKQLIDDYQKQKA